jgi:ATP synthase protein I
MVKHPSSEPGRERIPLSQHVAQARRKLREQGATEKGRWFGFDLLGLICSSVSLPLLLGVPLGVWIDQHYPSRASWTLGLFLIGLLLGCLNARRLVEEEYRAIRREQETEDKHNAERH